MISHNYPCLTEEAAATTHHRRHTMDIVDFTANFNPPKCDPFFNPLEQIPAICLGTC